MKQSIIRGVVGGVMLLGMSTSMTSAHVTVKPGEVGVAARQTFSVGVPNEKDIPTTEVRLLVPSGLSSVMPFVKPGWTVEIKESGEGEEAVVTELIWRGGSIPSDQRDEFLFGAKAPAEVTTLQWKAYQTYQGGTVVAWDQQPGGDSHSGDEVPNTGPYSETKIVDDISPTVGATNQTTLDPLTQLELMAGPIALLLSALALYFSLRKKSTSGS